MPGLRFKSLDQFRHRPGKIGRDGNQQLLGDRSTAEQICGHEQTDVAATKPDTRDSMHHAMYSEIPGIASQGLAVAMADFARDRRCLIDNNKPAYPAEPTCELVFRLNKPKHWKIL